MKKIVISTASFALVALLGVSVVSASGITENKKEQLMDLQEEISYIEEDGITSGQEVDQYRELTCQMLDLENELGLKNYIEDLELSLNTIETVSSEELAINDSDGFSSERIQLDHEWGQVLAELASKYRTKIANHDYLSAEALYDEYTEEAEGLRQHYQQLFAMTMN